MSSSPPKELACLIAAGGTAGHVRPALAVAEALRARGVRVTFAGSPDRVEARLVPEAGFELDTFSVSGLPRRPGLALLRALVRAAAAPRACSRILGRRRPDVVFGAGGYVAGPMVLAARLRGIPAALGESDAHLGLANRLAAPFARRVFLAYELPGRAGGKFRVTGRPIPTPSRPVARAEARALFGLPATGPVVCRVRRPRRSAQRSTRWRWPRGASAAPPCCTSRASVTSNRCAGACPAPAIVLLPSTDEFGAALAAADLAVSRARRHCLGARSGGHARGARPVPARNRRPPGAERALLRARRRRGRRAGCRGRARARARAPSCSRRPSGWPR